MSEEVSKGCRNMLIHLPQTSYQRLASINHQHGHAMHVESAAVKMNVKFVVTSLAGLVGITVAVIYLLLLEMFPVEKELMCVTYGSLYTVTFEHLL
jgi:hypothetical protein